MARQKAQGAFGDQWWAKRWNAAIERLTNPGRLRRGSAYARSGQVRSIEEQKGTIHARVQGSQALPYHVTISLTPLKDPEWAAVIDALMERAAFMAQLLAGQMPHEIEDAFTAAGVTLFPERDDELHINCSCPDWAAFCKHAAATHYMLGEQFDKDPFLLFRLRGRSREQIVAALEPSHPHTALAEDPALYATAPGLVKTGAEPPPELPSLEESLEQFWQMRKPLVHFSAAIHPPDVPYPILRRLGTPPFLSPPLAERLAALYDRVSQTALQAAYSAGSMDEEAPAGEVNEGAAGDEGSHGEEKIS
jgi:uncharacterized Zn finger protein